METSALYPDPSRRYVTYAARGMCATSNHLAAQAGVDMLKKGGNAFDAAIAAAACLVVLEPQTNGAGSDAFAIFTQNGGKLQGMNSTGVMGRGFDLQKMRDKGYKEMPHYGFEPVTVPGAPAAWAAINEKYGRLPLTEVLAPAISYAREGQALCTITWSSINTMASRMRENTDCGPQFDEWFRIFMPGGEAPRPGQLFRNPDLADTLEAIAKTQAKDYYQGEIADRIVAASHKFGGFFEKEDLMEHEVQWVQPLSVPYHGYEVWELPPNGQGIIALMALNILNGFEPSPLDDPRGVHRQIEATKLAFIDGLRYIADPRYMEVSPEEMLSPEYAAARRKLIGQTAIEPAPGNPKNPGTVYLCAADNEGNMISYIQSNYAGFGSGVVVPGTGIALQNRGKGFSLDPESPNAAAPGKRPYHTIIPGFLTKDGKPVGPFGVMGGFMQPQAHVQVMTKLIDCGLNPQACIDAPRWLWTAGKEVHVETEFSTYLADSLAQRGHKIVFDTNRGGFGKGQMILRTPFGTLIGGTEPRCEGACAAW